MSGASDKARFYLEQSVPELQEFERKKIFTKAEITSITKKRSDFEHKLNARGSSPADYARYAEYEMNLEALRKKRVKRLGVKTPAHTGQRRIFFILDRATRKFHGDVGLWMQYIEYARQENAAKKLSQMFTSVLRLHPTRPELWIYAASYVMDVHADMTEARSYMQRGLRFCASSKNLWLEYAKLEMIHIAKFSARRQVLGLDQESSRSLEGATKEADQVDMLALQSFTREAEDTQALATRTENERLLHNLDMSPAFTGAIPNAIFDNAMKEFPNDDTLAGEFFDLFATFSQVPCLQSILQHVAEAMTSFAPTSPSTLYCSICAPVCGVEPRSREFPGALRLCLSRLRSSMQEVTKNKSPGSIFSLAERVIKLLYGFSVTRDLDPDIVTVLYAGIRQTLLACEVAAKPDIREDGKRSYERLLEYAETLRIAGHAHHDMQIED